jgi:hypothetical protein
MVACTCHPSYAENINRRITVQPGWPGHNCGTLFEKYQKKKKKKKRNLKQKDLGVWLKWQSC